MENYSASLINIMQTPSVDTSVKKLGLPPANNLIPTKFDILPEDLNLSNQPHILDKTTNSLLWYMKDDQFLQPKAYVAIKIYCKIDEDPMGSVEKRSFANLW